MTSNQKSQAHNFIIGVLKKLDKRCLMNPGNKEKDFGLASEAIIEEISFLSGHSEPQLVSSKLSKNLNAT